VIRNSYNLIIIIFTISSIITYSNKNLILNKSTFLSFLSKPLLVNFFIVLLKDLFIYSLNFIIKKSFIIYIIIILVIRNY